MLSEDLIWYNNLYKNEKDLLDNYVPKYHDDDHVIKNPTLFAKMLVDSSGIKSETNLFTDEDISRIVNFMQPEKVHRFVKIRGAGHLLDLAASPFLRIQIPNQWDSALKAGFQEHIRVLLASIAQILIEGFDLVLHDSFKWDMPSNINTSLFNKYSYILDNKLIPIGPKDARFKSPQYKELFDYLDKLRQKRLNGGVRKSISKRFCECIKKVRSKVTLRNKGSKEGAAIAICTKSVLHSKGKTFRKFKCSGHKPKLILRKRVE